MKKRYFGIIIRLIITLLLIAYVFYIADLFSPDGWNKLLAEIKDANPYWLLVAILFLPVMDFISTLKWHYLAKKIGFSFSLGRLFIFYLVGRFFNLVLPSNIGGDFVRIHLMAKQEKRYAQAAAVVFLERLTGVVVLVFLALLSSFIALGHLELFWLNVAFVVAIFGLFILVWVVFDERVVQYLNAFLSKYWKSFSVFEEKTKKFRDALKFINRDVGVLISTFLYSLLFYVFAILNVWVSALVFQPEVELLKLVFAVPIIMFIMNIPVSIGGLGIAEFGHTFVLVLFGFSPELALSIALLMRIKSLIAAAVGAALYFVVTKWGVSVKDLSQGAQNEQN